MSRHQLAPHLSRLFRRRARQPAPSLLDIVSEGVIAASKWSKHGTFGKSKSANTHSRLPSRRTLLMLVFFYA